MERRFRDLRQSFLVGARFQLEQMCGLQEPPGRGIVTEYMQLWVSSRISNSLNCVLMATTQPHRLQREITTAGSAGDVVRVKLLLVSNGNRAAPKMQSSGRANGTKGVQWSDERINSGMSNVTRDV